MRRDERRLFDATGCQSGLTSVITILLVDKLLLLHGAHQTTGTHFMISIATTSKTIAAPGVSACRIECTPWAGDGSFTVSKGPFPRTVWCSCKRFLSQEFLSEQQFVLET